MDEEYIDFLLNRLYDIKEISEFMIKSLEKKNDKEEMFEDLIEEFFDNNEDYVKVPVDLFDKLMKERCSCQSKSYKNCDNIYTNYTYNG